MTTPNTSQTSGRLMPQALLDGSDVLVYLFQRGAADHLNALVPYQDPDYLAHRPTIGLLPPGRSAPGRETALVLDGQFGLHPALAPLLPLYQSGDLAFVTACGVPHGSRSHFQAQGLVERGVASASGPSSGWLGRYLEATAAPSDPLFRAIAISGNLPQSLQGADNPLAISELGSFGFDQGILDLGYLPLMNALYDGDSQYGEVANTVLEAVNALQRANLGDIVPGAQYPDSALGRGLSQAAQLIKSELPTQVICLDSDDWDHHENLPNVIAPALSDLAQSLSAFYQDLGSTMSRVTVVVHSEFGRRVPQNASNGTDHGTGGLCYLLGGGVNGGQVLGDWPGLSPAQLVLGEDLAITTDLRTVMAELISKRLGGADLEQVLPDFDGPRDTGAFL